MKRNLKILLTVVFVVTACFFAANSTVETQAATRNGWITRGGQTYYYENGKPHKGWLTLNGRKYFFNTRTGVQVKGWIKNSAGRRRYFSKSTGVMYTGWMTSSTGQKRYFDRRTGFMLTGLYKLSNNNYRYFNVSTGFMYTGLVKHGRYYYYFNPRTGYRFQGGMKKIGGRTYYFKSNGRAHTGWLTLKGKKYFFNSRGIMYANTTVMVQGKKYKFASNGAAVEVQDKWTKLLDRYKNNSAVKQLIFVQYEGGTRAKVLMYEKKGGVFKQTLSCQGYVGRNGINKVRAGDAKTPTGTFGFTMAFGRKNNPGAKISYTKLNPYLYWCADKKYYNKLIDVRKNPHSCVGEHLIDYNPQYNYALALDFNKEGIYGKGSAIFFHCAGSYPYTGGCISVSESNMIKIIQKVEKGAKICIYNK